MSKILFLNLPFVKFINGSIFTGPNAGSRWPWVIQGGSFHDYACYPFYMGYAAKVAEANGAEVIFYDGVAKKINSYDVIKADVASIKPDYIVFESAAPLIDNIFNFAKWAKESLGTINIFVGPYCFGNEEELIKKDFIDYCVTGEYEVPVLNILNSKAEKIQRFQFIEDINFINGKNFSPYRSLENIQSYNEPTINSGKIQFQVSTSRGCPFRCVYCQWPRVLNDHKYRQRLPELVEDEIRTEVQRCNSQGKIIRSILFDDDTWNVGEKRTLDLSQRMKSIGLPWSFMGRADTVPEHVYDKIVEAGCVGMRFGIESFSQKLLDNINKKMDAKKNYETIKYILSRFSGLEFHFTTMKRLPGEIDSDYIEDRRLLDELKSIGERNRNRVHWQLSDCVAFPGTELFDKVKNKHNIDSSNQNFFESNSPEYKTFSDLWQGDNYDRL